MTTAAGGMSREAEMSIAASSVFPGFRFSPTDVELISYYLKRKMEGHEKSVEVIPEVEIYKFEPWDLPAQSVIKSDGEWFFFCARGRKYPHGSQSRRATEMGYWKATGKERDVKSGSEVIGTKRTLVFHIGRAPKGERTEWIMHEYCMNRMSQDALVVCRLRRNAKFQAGSSQRQTLALQDSHCAISDGDDQTGVSECDKIPESYSATESEQKLSSDIAESSNRQQDSADDDFYAEILKDDIIKLDETSLLAPLTPVSKALPLKMTQQETVYSEALDSSNKECSFKKLDSKTDQPQGLSSFFAGLFWIKTVNGRRWNLVFMLLALFGLFVFSVWNFLAS